VVLDPGPIEFRKLELVLSGEERLRASGFVTELLRRRWTAAHGALRVILAEYVGIPPGSVPLTTDDRGKPKFAGTDPVLSFNLSHTGHLALVAVTAEGWVGVDAEIIRPDIAWEELGRRFFAHAEARQIASLSPEMRVPAFFLCWTRKEAYLKAIGLGLYAPLDKFQVTVRPDEAPRLVWVEGRSEEPLQWSFQDLSEPGVAAALAVRQPNIVVRRFSFPMPPSQGN
jgi:4'-phosphopantetheinyl transferase